MERVLLLCLGFCGLVDKVFHYRIKIQLTNLIKKVVQRIFYIESDLLS
jgi:hypothetical protein